MRIAEHSSRGSHHKKRIGRDISPANPWYLIDKMTSATVRHVSVLVVRKRDWPTKYSYTFTGFASPSCRSGLGLLLRRFPVPLTLDRGLRGTFRAGLRGARSRTLDGTKCVTIMPSSIVAAEVTKVCMHLSTSSTTATCAALLTSCLPSQPPSRRPPRVRAMPRRDCQLDPRTGRVDQAGPIEASARSP